MKNISRVISIVCITGIMSTSLFARIFVGDPERKKSSNHKAADCAPATGTSYLSVNNVRAYIETSGSMWFRQSKAEYFIPKNGQASSMFAAALWIGGRDVAGQLKLAAISFRQRGDDFWPGPLTLNDATISQATCTYYDRHFFMSKAMAKEHRDRMAAGDPDYRIPPEIEAWPGNPEDEKAGQSWYLAPYVDVDGDDKYTPKGGDYPYYDFDNELCPWTPENRARAARGELPKTPETEHKISTGGIMADQVLKGDETLWWVFNDKGGPHTESKGDPIGLEIRAQAFGFATADELNNMTFYSYEIINRSTFALTETYFSQWVDPDLGDPKDDYVGCDVERGLGYCYNGKTPDGNGLPTDYGLNPPAVGVDFFQGPYLDPDGFDNPSYNKKEDDNIYGPSFNANYDNVCEIVTQHGTMGTFTWDATGNGDTVTKQVLIRAEAINGVNFGDGIVDNERYGMRRFVYHNNTREVTGDPRLASEYYNLLRGIWRDNTRMRFGKDGHVSKTGLGAPEADFMFPGESDPCNWGTNGIPTTKIWTEEEESNQPNDRRFMQSAGPFTLQRGAINYITVGIPWARATGTPMASVKLLQIADDKAQTLFESCFKVIDGPDAPDLVFREMDKSFICYITNSELSNNHKESYYEIDRAIPPIRVKEVVEIVKEEVFVQDTIKGSGGQDSIIYVKKLMDVAVTRYDTIHHNQYYAFEGYQVYQLLNELVSANELSDVTKAQLVFQCDIKNKIKQIINYEYNAVVQTEVAVEKVNGEDLGIRHSFTVSEDKFGGALINHKKYYYMVIAYAHNELFQPYSDASYSTNSADGLFGQKKPYLMGNKNIKTYTVIPHVPYMEEKGIVTQSVYGDRPQITQLEGQGNGGLEVRLEQKTIEEILKNNKADSLVFKQGYGPIDVKVVDPLKVIGTDFTLRFCDMKIKDSLKSEDVVLHTFDIPSKTKKGDTLTRDTFMMVMASAVTKNTYWILQYNDTIICSERPISEQNEQFLLDLGISITITDARFSPLDDFINDEDERAYMLLCGVDFISTSVEYTNGAHPWFRSVEQVDGTTAANWIRSGTTLDGDWKLKDQSHVQKRKEAYYFPFQGPEDMIKYESRGKVYYTIFYDKGKNFGKAVGGMTWAPYVLASAYDNNPGAGYHRRERPPYLDTVRWNESYMENRQPFMTEIYSVDVVLTSNKDLWTRCPVVEISDDTIFAGGGARRHDIRKSPSVGKDGNQDGTGTGMGWFPGYAICVETGERLNIMFGENSSLSESRGADMKFNPTSGGMGGGHYIYIMGHRDLYMRSNNSSYAVMRVPNEYNCPAYDEGKWLRNQFDMITNGTEPDDLKMMRKHFLYKNALWTTIPLSLYNDTLWLEKGNDVKISLRVSRPYQRYSSTNGVGVSNPQNNNMPMYRFSTKGLATLTNQKHVAESYMDSIYVVPNPYYGMSGYEANQLDTRVRFINLPSSYVIKIYAMDGTLIKTISYNEMDNTGYDRRTYQEWELKNEVNIPISSGMYLIHIKDENTKKEKTLKFLCIQRPIDVNAF